MIVDKTQRRRVSPDGRGDNAWLTGILSKPGVTATFAELPALWSYCDIVFECKAPEGFRPGAWMARSVRGAIGRILKDWHETGQRCDLPATAFEVFYQNHLQLQREHVPKPIRFSVAATGRSITISMRIYGRAFAWLDVLVEAAIAGCHKGIGLAENSSTLRPWPVQDWWWCQARGLDLPKAASGYALAFTTPFKPGASHIYQGDLRSALRSLDKRTAPFARWFGLACNAGDPQIRFSLDSLMIEPISDSPRFDGFIKRESMSREIAVVGILPTFILRNVDDSLLPLLAVGQGWHLGGHNAYGFGQYRLY